MIELTFQTEGIHLRGWRMGAGRPLLMVHGWSQSSRLYLPLAERLAATQAVFSYDLRGHGESSKPEDGYTLGQMAVDLHHVLQQLSVDRVPVTLLGHSMGCAIIYKHIEIFSADNLAALILIDQSPRMLAFSSEIGSKLSARSAKMSFPMLRARVAALRSPFTSFDYVDTMFTDRASSETRLLAHGENRKLNRAAAAALLWDAALHDWWRLTADITLPSLVIGNSLGAYPVADLRRMAERMICGRYVEFSESDGGAHMVILENPDAVAAHIQSFLATFDVAS